VNPPGANEPLPYFAYGSNMWAPQMEERCPGSTVIGLAQLAGYRFLINSRGYATVTALSPLSPLSPTSGVEMTVHGVLWRVSDGNMAKLDRYEGVADGRYLREKVALSRSATTTAAPGEAIEAIVYRDPITTTGPPRPGYLERVVNGATAEGIPERYIEEVLRRCF